LKHFIADEIEYEIASTMLMKAFTGLDNALVIHHGTEKGIILVLPEKCNYYRAAQDLERTQRDTVNAWEILFIVLPREDGNYGNDDKWQIHTVNVPGQQFVQKANVLASEIARDVIGDDLVFVHNNRFIGVTANRDSAINLAVASMDAHYVEEADRHNAEKWWQQPTWVIVGRVLDGMRYTDYIAAFAVGMLARQAYLWWLE
jgi:uncharacterized UPF0160 family protein